MANGLARIEQIRNLPTELNLRVINDGNIKNLEAGADTDKPAAGNQNKVYFSTDTGSIYYDDGTQWVLLSDVSSSNDLNIVQDNILVGDSNGDATETPLSGISLDKFGSAENDLNLGANKITTTATNFGDNDLITKNYVSGIIQGVSWKDSVRVATDQNIDITNPGTQISGVTLNQDDRVLLFGQTDGTENGIYVFNGDSSPLTRSLDLDEDSEASGASIFVLEGNFADKGFVQNNDNVVIDTDALNFTQFTGATSISVGSGLQKSNGQISLDLDDQTIGIKNDKASVISNGNQGQVLKSVGTPGEPAQFGDIDLSQNYVTGSLPVDKGGIGLNGVSKNSIVYADANDSFSELGILDNSFVGRIDGSDVQNVSLQDIGNKINPGFVADSGTATNGSMTLLQLSQDPSDKTVVQISINGIDLNYNADFTIDNSRNVIATQSLNEAYGGTGTDGSGFEDTDLVYAYYVVNNNPNAISNDIISRSVFESIGDQKVFTPNTSFGDVGIAVPSNKRILIKSILATNITSDNSIANLNAVVDNGVNQTSISPGIEVNANTSEEVLKRDLVLEPGDTIQAKTNTASSVQLIISYSILDETRYFRTLNNISSTNSTTVLTKTNDSYIESLIISNTSGNNEGISVIWTDNNDNEIAKFVKDFGVAGNISVELFEKKKLIPAGDKLKVVATTGGVFNVVVSGRVSAT